MTAVRVKPWYERYSSTGWYVAACLGIAIAAQHYASRTILLADGVRVAIIVLFLLTATKVVLSAIEARRSDLAIMTLLSVPMYLGFAGEALAANATNFGDPPGRTLGLTLFLFGIATWRFYVSTRVVTSLVHPGTAVDMDSQNALIARPIRGAPPTPVLIALSIITLSLAVFSLPPRLRTPPFDPLQLPTQLVLNHIDGVDGPALHIGEDLKVEATKCNTSGHEVGVTGHATWRSVSPAGSVVEGSSGSSVRPGEPRCVTRVYANPVPPAVLDRTRELLDEGNPSVAWQLSGIETPLGPGAVQRAWTTETFVILP